MLNTRVRRAKLSVLLRQRAVSNLARSYSSLCDVIVCIDAVPDRVLHVGVKRRASTSLHLQWDPPPVVNGILVGYTITYKGALYQKHTHTHADAY